MGARVGANGGRYLLHDASFPLGEGDVSTRLVLNELDVNLATLSAGFVVVVVVIIGGGADTGSLDATVVGTIGIVGIIGAGGV